MANKVIKKENVQKEIKPIVKQEIANLIGEAVKETYGVVGLTKVNTIKNQLIILKRENYVDGVLVTKTNKGKYDVDVHLVVAYGVKITEVVNEVSKRVAYELKKKYGDVFNGINVYVEDLLDL